MGQQGRASGTTVGAGIIRQLGELGVDTVFGIPGVHTLEFYRGIRAAGIRHVLNRSEHGAVFAADGYARVTGRPGVALLISGPGVTNAATAIAQAYHDSIPILVVSAVVERSRLSSPSLHSMPDQHGFMSTITGWCRHVEDPAEIGPLIARAFDEFSSGRPRPVNIQVPADVLFSVADMGFSASIAHDTPAPLQAGDLDAAVELIDRSERPLLLLGGGAVDAGPEVRVLAEKLAAPVVETLNAKGTLPDRHPLALGTRLATKSGIAAVSEADVVIAVGTEFCEIDYYYAGYPEFSGDLVRIDIDPTQLQAEFPAAVGIQGSARAVLAALTDRVAPAGDERLREATLRVEQIRATDNWWERSIRLDPVVAMLGEWFADDAIVAVDSTQLGYIGQQRWPAHRSRSWLIPSGWGTLGPALPMAIGAAVGQPDRPVYAVVGDGGLLFTVGEMAAAASLGVDLTLILWNNGGYQEMRAEFAAAGIEAMGTDATTADFQLLARGFGWHSFRPNDLDELRNVLVQSRTMDGPVLIELTPAVLG